jgi:adenosylcobyric acid synthase
MGRTDLLAAVDSFIVKETGNHDGAIVGNVAGTYFHGLFDNVEFTQKFLAMVAENRRLEWRPPAFNYSKDDEYDRLATTARDHLNMQRIDELIVNG